MNIDEARILRWALLGYLAYRFLRSGDSKPGAVQRQMDAERQHQTIGTSTPFST